MNSEMPQKDSCQVVDPFIYKIQAEDYVRLIRFAINNPNLFREIKRFRERLVLAKNDAKAYRAGYGQLREYQKLLRRWQKTEWQQQDFREQALLFLEELENYHYFFKETGAGLKFNPLSTRSSGRELRIRMLNLLETHLTLIRPRALYLFVDTILEESGITVASTNIRFKSRKLADFFLSRYDSTGTSHSGTYSAAINDRKRPDSGKLRMILYLVTIGPGIDDTVKSLMRTGQMFDAYLLNGTGGGAAEMVAYDLNLFANDQFADDKIPARYQRFSPGYGDWSVRDQQKVFALLKPEQHIGVILSEGGIMIPEKSTSGIMGLKMLPHK